ncbi:MAG: Regulator of RpoS [Thermoanaerobaculia bacterium]|nr:Regulator of RpoS [Thermoanaerobaculia bacterium]
MAILIVDDSPVNLKVLSAILTKAGFTCIEAQDGPRALHLAQSDQPDLVILDIMMPEMDGFQVCQALKESPKTKEIPVIFLSALGEASNKVRGLELGAEDYITKPFDRAEVVARVRTQLRIREMTRSLRELNRELLEKQERIRRDLKAAGEIQRMFLPRPPLGIKGVEAAWVFEPCDQVGGDIFNVVKAGPDHVVIYMLDVSGHGVPAALVSASVFQSLSPAGGLIGRHHSGGFEIARPVDVLERLEIAYPLERFDKYFTLAYLVLELSTGRLRYSCAGHPAPVVLRRTGEVVPLEKGGPFIGLGLDLPWEEGEIELGCGDRLVVITDGVLEQVDAAGELFGMSGLAANVADSLDRSLSDLCKGLVHELHAFSGQERFRDDISVLALEYSGRVSAV